METKSKPRKRSLPATPLLVNTHTLAVRWQVCPRTVLRVCRLHALAELRLTAHGRILFLITQVAALETELHLA